MKTKKILRLIVIFIISLSIISGFIVKARVQTKVKELFKMNKSLQEEGYYMAEFEFRMMSVLYYLDKGKYIKALTLISDYHKKLSQKERLIKIPDFKNNREEADFYLGLQNTETGAFVDADTPYFIWYPITANVLEHIEALLDTVPIKLKYPLKFMDRTNTPEKLEVYLNDLAYVGWLAPKFPMTSFVFVREQMSCAREDNVLERNQLYQFSREWKHSYIKWMYEFQDEETGMWGPKFRKSKRLAVKDLDNTASILKQFRDNSCKNRYADFPLKYGNKLFESTLEALCEPFPEDDDLTEIHAWNLKISKGINMLLRYIWNEASEVEKNRAKEIFTAIIKVEFEKFYVKGDGAFSYYPNAEHATCDGMTNFKFDDIGVFSYEKQKKYWGEPEQHVSDLGTVTTIGNQESASGFLEKFATVNSIRVYTSPPDFKNLFNGVYAVFYPQATVVLDAMEVVPNIVAWTETSKLSMGNWTSMAEIKNSFAPLNIQKPLIFKDSFPLVEIQDLLKDGNKIFLVGFNVLQLPELMIKVE